MNSRIIAGFLLIVHLGSFNPTVAMHGKILRGVQIVTSGAVIGVYGKKAYEANEKLKKPIELDPASAKVTAFVHEGLVKMNIPNATKVPVVMSNDFSSPWFCYVDKVIGVDYKTALAIEAEDYIALQEGQALERHEIKHLLNKDFQKRIYALAAVPCGVQAVSSGMTYVFNRLVKRQEPKKIFPLIGRSLVAAGAMAPKLFMSTLGFIGYMRYQEVQADQFACEHAESREELEAFKNFFDKIVKPYEQAKLQQSFDATEERKRSMMIRLVHFINDKEHPYPGDRAAMVQKYIDKWDAEHKA